MTRALYDLNNRGSITVESDGRVSVEVPLHVFCAIDGSLAEVAALAQEQPGVAIVIPNWSRVPRPRNSVVYGVSQ